MADDVLTTRIIAPANTRERLEILTNGRIRWAFRPEQPAVEGAPATSSPDAPVESGSGVFFFRSSGGVSQFCVRFPSGAVQILATEP